MSTKYQKVPADETTTNYRVDLEATFNESLTEEEGEGEVSYRHITDSHGLLGITSQFDNSHHFVSTSSSSNNKKPTPITNDGVFKNISTSQQQQQQQHDDHPPSYSDATMDTTPPYWQTTIFESSSPSSMDRNNIILVNGLPVGSLFIFFWNLLISACFQFVGFLLTYILYTSHAGKNGSRAGLGVSLVQLGFYIRGCSKLNFDFDFDFDFDNDQDDNDQEDDDDDDDDNFNNIYIDIIAYFFMILGWFIIIKSIADYLKAKKMEKIIKTDSIISDGYTSSNNNNSIRMINMERIV